MIKFKVGDKIRFIDNKDNRSYWSWHYTRSFNFEDILTVKKIYQDLVIVNECRYNTSAFDHRFEKVIQKGQLQLPFKGGFK